MNGPVLIVDDDPEVRATLAECFGEAGFEVVEAANGLEALQHVRRSRPRAVVLDVMMPRLGGLEALKRIRALDADIAVLVVTGVQDVEVQRRALELGALAVFTKPVAPDVLVRALGAGPGPGAPAPTPPPRPAEPVATGRVLVVDDEPEVREQLEEFCAAQGWAVHAAADGASGVRAVLDRAPDVVLLDIGLPGLSGVAALPAIFAVAPLTRVIMVSGTSDAELARRTLAHGAFDFVTKPVDLEYLKQSVDAALTAKALDEAR